VGWDNNWVWQSDWSGDEVGYPEILIVGCYMIAPDTYAYIDIENTRILEQWTIEDDED